MNAPLLASLSSNFSWIDWAVVVGYLAFTTYLGAKLAGRQASIRDFFLGGRKLPWYAVSGSIIATEISALTFVSVPSVVFKMDVEGNFKYLQLGIIGTFIARIIVGYVLVPAYYKREIYSPYDYMGNQLGSGVRSMSSVLFSLGGILGQSARVYLTAEVLMVVMRDQLVWLQATTAVPALAWAIFFIGVVSVGWTLIGGITTVIWTDVILFLVFLLGAFVALGTVALNLQGGAWEMFRVGWEAKGSGPWGKFTFFDFELSPFRQYTIWTAAIASTWGGLGAYGTDQLLAQRMFCCKNARDARWAIISSTLGQIVTVTVMLVGVGLFAYYKQTPPADATAEFLQLPAHEEFPMLRGEALEMYAQKADRIFPIFIVEKIPTGLKGLIIAAIFAAAISSLMGILTALSQVVMAAFYNPLRERRLRRRGIEVSLSADSEALIGKQEPTAEDRRSVRVGRLMVVFWGVVLCGMAYLAERVAENYKSILDLGLAMVGFTGGALLAAFALSFLPLRIDGRGLMWSAPLSVFCVFAVVCHQDWAADVCQIAGAMMIVTWLWAAVARPPEGAGLAKVIVQAIVLVAGAALSLWLCNCAYWPEIAEDGKMAIRTIAWPWYVPIGSTVAFVWGYLLARRRSDPV
ncbi:MAG: sodium:solute symporter family transporter [Planctomycetota bacterium]|jgi:Na+/proline symporter